jgi:predicted amidohydrolase YtcJ
MIAPDRILHHGHILTLDSAQPHAEALAILGERIVAIGSNDAILPLAGPGTSVEHLDRRTVIPGLTDAHIHWQLTSEMLQQINLFDLPDLQATVDKVAQKVAQTPPGEWVVGYGWQHNNWPDARFPTAADIDAISPRNPVYLIARSSHAAWVNTAALKATGITADTRAPEGTEIRLGPDGQPNGMLIEPAAMNLVKDRIPRPTTEQTATAMLAAQKAALSLGLTGFHDFDEPECLRALQILRERGELGLRVVKQVNQRWLNAALDSGLRWGFGDHWIRIGGLKIFADGALGPRSASMLQPYESEPNNTGIIVVDKEQMVEDVSRASAAGLPSTIHAIGDRAVRDVLDVYQAVRAEEAQRGEARNTRRHRIEHVQLIHPDDVGRLSELDIIASMQPIHGTSDMVMADRFWGARSRLSYNPRVQLDRGVVVAFGSDSPVETFNPFVGIHAAVTRRRPDGSPGPEGWYPEARVSLDEALRGYTSGPAYAAGMERDLGKLATGYLADLVVLDRDLTAIPPHELKDVRVGATMVGGVWRHGGV